MQNAEKIAHTVMENLGGAGVFGIEMFVTINGKILVNEIAPRMYIIQAIIHYNLVQHQNLNTS